jgi:ABC-type antimicrobial peptide transport system permease subunit
LCLSAIVYVNIIDKRKYEFAMLRANGLTKGEIRKLVMIEMAVQAVWTFAVSLLLAWVVFLILSNTIGGFQFDWMTVMWLAVISVVSVILPSVVALVLTNKYEPDAIMRN